MEKGTGRLHRKDWLFLRSARIKMGRKKILKSTRQSIIFWGSSTWPDGKRNYRTGSPDTHEPPRWQSDESQMYFKEVLNKALPEETGECQFHYIKPWWNLGWIDGCYSGHPGPRRLNSHLKRCTGAPQQCSGNRKFLCVTVAITISATWGCGKTLVFLSLIQPSSSQCRETWKKLCISA